MNLLKNTAQTSDGSSNYIYDSNTTAVDTVSTSCIYQQEASSGSLCPKQRDVQVMSDAVNKPLNKERVSSFESFNIVSYLSNDEDIDIEGSDYMDMYLGTKAGGCYSEISADDLLSSETGTSQYFNSIGMQQNLSENNGNGKFICEVCKKEFSSKGNMTAHIKRMHIRNQIYKCPDCDMESYYIGNITKHRELKHNYNNKESEATCRECGTQIYCRESLIIHMDKYHKDAFLYYCPECQKGFNLQLELKRHRYSEHSMVGIFKCVLCDMTFNTKDELVMHNKSIKHQVVDAECARDSECQEAYEIDSSLNNAEYKCLLCKIIFMTKYCLEKHSLTNKHQRAVEWSATNSEYQEGLEINSPLKKSRKG